MLIVVTLPQPYLGVKMDGRMTNGWVFTVTWFKHSCELWRSCIL